MKPTMWKKLLILTMALLAVTSAGYAQVPQLINYQGRVVVGTTNFDGSGSFKFALVNAAGTTMYWSNDGTSANGSEPTNAVSLTVAKGLYSVLLGDTSLTNMTAVPPSVFNNSDVRLRVWFNDGTHGSQLLTPDQRIAAVGYAVMAGNVPDGAITSAKIATGAVGSTQLASGAVTSAQIDTTTVQQRVSGSAPAGQFIKSINADGTVVTAADINSGGTVTSVATGSGLSGGPITGFGTIAVDNTIPRLATANTFTNLNYFTGGNVGIGTTAPTSQLHVYNNSTNPTITLETNLNGAATLLYMGRTGHLWRVGTTGAFQDDFFIASQGLAVAPFNILPSGNVGIGTTNPAAKLDVNGSINTAGDFSLPATTSASAGVITQNGSRLMHTFGNQQLLCGSWGRQFNVDRQQQHRWRF